MNGPLFTVLPAFSAPLLRIARKDGNFVDVELYCGESRKESAAPKTRAVLARVEKADGAFTKVRND